MYFATLNCTVPDKDIYYSGWDISSILPKIIILDSLNKNWGGGGNGDLHRSTLQSKGEDDCRYLVIFLLRRREELKKTQAKQ